MKTGNLRAVPATRSLQRERLASTILSLDIARRRELDTAARIRVLDDEIYAAIDAAETARAAAEKARQAEVANLADPGAPAPMLTQKAARQAIADAEEQAATLREALATAREASAVLSH